MKSHTGTLEIPRGQWTTFIYFIGVKNEKKNFWRNFLSVAFPHGMRYRFKTWINKIKGNEEGVYLVLNIHQWEKKNFNELTDL